MKARPKIEDYYTKDYESNQDAVFFERYKEDWHKWAEEAETELMELREIVQYAYDVAQGHDKVMTKIKQALK